MLTLALYSRFASRGQDDFANKVFSALRKQFGGHAESRPESDVARERLDHAVGVRLAEP